MRQRRLRKYLKTLEEIRGRKKPLKRDNLHQALGAAKKEAGRDARHVNVCVTFNGKGESQTATLSYKLNRATLRVARRREGRYLLRTNIKDTDPAKLWEFYLQLNEVEQAFKELKARLRRCANGLTPRAVLEKFAAIQMLDVHLPTTDGREIVLSRYTQPERDVCLLLDQLNLTLPEQAPPKIQSTEKR